MWRVSGSGGALAGVEPNLLKGVVVDDPEALLLDVAEDGGAFTDSEGEAIPVVVVHSNDVVGRREPHVRVAQKVERDGGHADGAQAAQVVARIENVELAHEVQVVGGVAERVADRGVRRGLQAGDGGAGVDDGAAVAVEVELEGGARDGQQVAAHADARDLDVVVGGHSRVAQLRGELHAGGCCVVRDCSVAEDQRRPLVGIRFSVWETIREHGASHR